MVRWAQSESWTIHLRDFNGARGSMRTVAIPWWVISPSQRSQLRCWDGEDTLARRVTDLAHVWAYGRILFQICGKKKWSSHSPHLTRLVTENQIHIKGKQSMHIGHEDARLAEAKWIFLAFFISCTRTELLIQQIMSLSCHRLGITEI